MAHVRYASTGAHTVANTHPFSQDRRLLAHNGAFGGLPKLDVRLVELGADGLVGGQTDSERMFALITAEARRNGGDIGAAIGSAVTWIADNLPVFALNLILATANDLWALRFPATHRLYVLDRTRSPATLEVSSPRIRARSDELSDSPAVIVASEPMDGESAWRLMDPGELTHIDADLTITTTRPFPDPPRFPLTLADMTPAAAASQGAAAQSTD